MLYFAPRNIWNILSLALLLPFFILCWICGLTNARPFLKYQLQEFSRLYCSILVFPSQKSLTKTNRHSITIFSFLRYICTSCMYVIIIRIFWPLLGQLEPQYLTTEAVWDLLLAWLDEVNKLNLSLYITPACALSKLGTRACLPTRGTWFSED